MGRALMTLSSFARRVGLAVALGLFGLSGAAMLPGLAPALAQSAACEQGGKLLTERKNIIAQLNGRGKKIDARTACTAFGKLVTNGNATVQWVDANKEWCSVPDTFASGIKNDHAKAVELRTKACAVAQQQAVLEKKARQQAKQAQSGGGGGLLGGPGLTGEYKVPQGAL